MGDMREVYKAMKESKRTRHAANRKLYANLLNQAGVPFSTNNDGVHLIVDGGDSGKIDFWPGTGKWIARSGKNGKGISTLLSAINRNSSSTTTAAATTSGKFVCL